MSSLFAVPGNLRLIYILLFIQGVYSQFFQAVMLRELVTRFGGIEITFVIAISAMLVWAAAGCAAASLLKGFLEKHFHLLVFSVFIFSPLTSLFSFVGAALAPPLFGGNYAVSYGLFELIVFCALAPLPFGIVNGLIYGLLSTASGKERAGEAYSADAAGDTLGGLLFSLFIAGIPMPLGVLALTGMLFPVSSLSVLFFNWNKREQWWGAGGKIFVLFSSLLACLFCLLLSVADETLSVARWKRLMPALQFEKSIETPGGRVDFLCERDGTGKRCRELFYAGGALAGTFPSSPELSLPAAVFGVVQVGEKGMDVLVNSSPFSSLPQVLDKLPPVDSVDFVCPDLSLVHVASDKGLLPSFSGRFRLINDDFRAFVRRLNAEGAGKRYDLIVVSDVKPDTLAGNRFFTEEFFRESARLLRPGGVLLTFVGSGGNFSSDGTLAFNSSVVRTLRKVFPRVVLTPGQEKIIAAGGGNITGSFSELDKRILKLMPDMKEFPSGMMSVLYSQSEADSESAEIVADAERVRTNSDFHPVLPFYFMRYHSNAVSGVAGVTDSFMSFLERVAKLWPGITGFLLLFYVVLRYLLSRRTDIKLSFSSFENGFYAFGIELVLLFFYQNMCGALYRDIAAAVGIFIGGTALGAWRGRAKIFRDFFSALSFVLPLGVFCISGLCMETTGFLIYAMLLLSGISVGAAYTGFNISATANRASGFWGWEMAGGAFAALFLSLFLLPAGGLTACIALLMLCRLPLLSGVILGFRRVKHPR